MITKFITYINEEVDYSTYSKSLNEDEFFHLYFENCKDFNPRMPLLERGQKTNTEIIYIDASKHEAKLQPQSLPMEIFMNVTKNSKRWNESGYPNKVNSLDVVSKNYGSSFFGSPYVVIPYDKAKFIVAKSLVGNRLPHLDKIFNKHSGGNSVWINKLADIEPPSQIKIDTNPIYFCENLIQDYYKYTKKRFDNKNVIGCLKELEPYIKGPIKDEMVKRKMGLVEFLDFCFDPVENGFEKCSYDDLYKKDGIFFAWTTSELILVEKGYYNAMKNKLCVIYDKKINI